VRQWEQVARNRGTVKTLPALLYEDLDITLRTARDYFTEDVQKISSTRPRSTSGCASSSPCSCPSASTTSSCTRAAIRSFDEYGIEDEIARALARKVPLPSGGYLIIDQAEALTAIDVNTGRFTGKGRDVEETIYQTNLEAVREIAYQLRFRNIGGLIVLDFIDMERAGNRDRVYKRSRSR